MAGVQPQVSSSIEIYRIFEAKKDFSPEEAAKIASALEQKDNLATKDDLHGLETRLLARLHEMDKKMLRFGLGIMALIIVTNPRVLDFFGRFWTVLPK